MEPHLSDDPLGREPVRDNIARVREGEKPVPFEKMRIERLLLPKAAGLS